MPTTANELVAPLFDGLLDIVGDVHGEYLALRQLLRHLGYDEHGEHPAGRRLVFVGDLCDRGPDSPAVVNLVRDLIERELAQCVLGNHELNLLRQERKSGNGWMFEEHPDHQRAVFADCRRATARERADIRRFFGTLPLALEREDLRVAHAAWHDPSLERLRDTAPQSTLTHYKAFEDQVPTAIPAALKQAAERERRQWAAQLTDRNALVPMLTSLAELDEHYQVSNPVRVLTSGLEQRCDAPFYASGKWRMVSRVPWWQNYDDTPVIVGHYWRWWDEAGSALYSRGEPDLFAPAGPLEWMGPERAVYCVDFSVGARFREITDGFEPGQYTRLGAVRWPENELVFDNSERYDLVR